MTVKRLAMMLLLVLAAAVVQPQVSNMPLKDNVRGPTISEPRIHMAPNGDRVSHYPPYFHPDH